MRLPKIIDNERSSMLDVLRDLSNEHEKVSIATGYWDLGAISLLLGELDSLKEIRLLIEAWNGDTCATAIGELMEGSTAHEHDHDHDEESHS